VGAVKRGAAVAIGSGLNEDNSFPTIDTGDELMTRTRTLILAVCGTLCASPLLRATGDDALPFQQKVEVYRNEEGDINAFRLRLEQPFLAEEFEKSNYLRLNSTDKRAYLIYPKETKFQQKHAEFYGRLRGEGDVTLKLSYEIVSENPDGSRRVEVRDGDVRVAVPQEQVGSNAIFTEWARQQNQYFARLLRYYPEETFFQYCLLQSQARYGVAPPAIPKQAPDRNALETSLYQVFTKSLAIQESLQRETLGKGSGIGDLTKHVSSLRPPSLRSLPYERLLEEKRTRGKTEPKPHDVATLVPEDQYFLHFNAMQPLGELADLTSHWGDAVARLFTLRAQDSQVRAKLENQLCMRWNDLIQLSADEVIGEVAITGADPFVLEGTDVTLILQVKQPEAFQKASAGWLEEIRNESPKLVSREFNYRGQKVNVHYTNDRMVSAFAVTFDDYSVYSNSHRAIRRVIDVAVGLSPGLCDALDYRYVTTILPPTEAANTGYFFASEAFIKRLVGPEAKISEKRRLQCFNNLVMLNNASLFYRLENGRSPESLTDLIEGGFVDRNKIVCPHGGGYAFDAEHDMCTCSLHNRLRYLTPNLELSVLKISEQEAAEYERYKRRYESFWKTVFDPVAIRITVDSRLKFESCVLPFANGGLYGDLRGIVDQIPQPIGTERIAPSAVASLVMVPGRENIARFLGGIPGLAEVLQANPTLTDMEWLGDRFGLHFCDGETILQIDATQLGSANLPMLGDVPFSIQAAFSAILMAANVPAYVTVDIESREHAARLLDQLSQQIFLTKKKLIGALQLDLDAYRLPDYKEHAIYAFSGQMYVLKTRLHVALVGKQLVAATKPEILREVIDVSTAEETGPPTEAHMLLRLNRRAIKRLYDDLQLYWTEKSRIACHRNIISVYNLCKLYDIPVDQVAQLSEAKYGVRYFCPDHGDYSFDAGRDQVVCSIHGNRQHSQQNAGKGQASSFGLFMDSLDEIIASLRFREDAAIATIEIVRTAEGSED